MQPCAWVVNNEKLVFASSKKIAFSSVQFSKKAVIAVKIKFLI